MRSIVNKIRLCVRKYLIYLENSDKKKRNGKEGIYARGGGRRKGILARAFNFLPCPQLAITGKVLCIKCLCGLHELKKPLEVCHRVFANPVLCERKNVYAS